MSLRGRPKGDHPIRQLGGTAVHTGRRQALRFALGAGAAMAGAAVSPAALCYAGASLQWRDRALIAFGTTVWLQAGHADAAVAEAGIAAAAAAVQRVDQEMSLFRPDSQVCRLNREGLLLRPDAELVSLLRLARKIAAESSGQFDPTVQPLWALWARSHGQGRRPDAAELAAARALVDWRGLQVSDTAIRLARPGMAITLNGIAQGHAADMARAALLRHGVRDALLDTGEWWPMGASRQGGAWQLGVADPRGAKLLGALLGTLPGTLPADGRALACSSDDKLAFSTDRRDHHILDPRSGYSPTELATVVVAAHSAALADGLTKPMFMGGLNDALALARRWGVDVLAVDKAGRVVVSKGLALRRV